MTVRLFINLFLLLLLLLFIYVNKNIFCFKKIENVIQNSSYVFIITENFNDT